MTIMFKPKVLVLDENSKELSSLSVQLSSEGIEVIQAKSPKEGLDQLSLANVDAIITKVDLKDGKSTLSFNKDQLASYPILLIGSKNKKEMPKEWIEASDNYIQEKDIKKNLVKETLTTIQERKQFRNAA
jgi:DNA-binding response OmpR family regulator